MRLLEFLNCEDEYKMLLEIRFNVNDTNNITFIKQLNGYIFTVDDTEFIMRGYHISDNSWWIKFGIHQGNGNLKDIEMTNKGSKSNTMSVLENVCKSIIMFVKEYNPEEIQFDADRPSRQKMYERILQLMISNWGLSNYTPHKKIESDTSRGKHYIIRRNDKL